MLGNILVKAQDCTTHTKIIEDRVEGVSAVTLKDVITFKSKDGSYMLINMINNPNGYISMDFILSNHACINKNAKAKFLFSDSTRMESFTETKFNCKGNIEFKFGTSYGNIDEAKKLMQKTIDTIRIYTEDSFIDRKLTIAEAKKFKESFTCIYKNM